VPIALAEVLIERGNYPPGDEKWAWATTVALAVGALVFFRLRVPAIPALVFDLAVVSCYVLVYSFELGTPVRQLLLLPVLEGALRYGLRGGLVTSLLTLPALALFEWRQAVRLDLYPFDIGHVLGPFGIELLLGLVVGALVGRLRHPSIE
jgi:hypothetical protein